MHGGFSVHKDPLLKTGPHGAFYVTQNSESITLNFTQETYVSILGRMGISATITMIPSAVWIIASLVMITIGAIPKLVLVCGALGLVCLLCTIRGVHAQEPANADSAITKQRFIQGFFNGTSTLGGDASVSVTALVKSKIAASAFYNGNLGTSIGLNKLMPDGALSTTFGTTFGKSKIRFVSIDYTFFVDMKRWFLIVSSGVSKIWLPKEKSFFSPSFVVGVVKPF